MDIVKYPSAEAVNSAVCGDRMFTAAVSFCGKTAFAAPSECGSHDMLLVSCGVTDTRSFFKLTFNQSEAQWLFDCPPNYKGISDSSERISAYYTDGINALTEFLILFGYMSKLTIKNAPPEIWEF